MTSTSDARLLLVNWGKWAKQDCLRVLGYPSETTFRRLYSMEDDRRKSPPDIDLAERAEKVMALLKRQNTLLYGVLSIHYTTTPTTFTKLAQIYNKEYDGNLNRMGVEKILLCAECWFEGCYYTNSTKK